MKILYNKSQGVAIQFSPSEIKIALIVLKSIHQWCGAGFIKEVIDDIEEDLKPKMLPMINYHHVCSRCCTMIDDRVGNNFVHYVNGNTDEWRHHECHELKKNRP